ncbi:MAG: ComEC/Rec2 family competence protein [Chitinophagaceae bacterium]|nr:ComEC/Rec2 family competence protein [Chitinophagaceae bacterium]
MHAAPLIAWKQAPFLRLIIPFSAGIVIQFYTYCPPIYLLSSGAIALIIILCLSKASIPTLFKFKYFIAYAFLVLLATTGAWRMHLRSQAIKPTPIAHIQDSAYTYLATIEEPVTEKQSSFKTVAQLTHRLSGDSLIPINTTILLYFQKNPESAGLYYGHKILFNKQLQPVKAPANPGSFNYKAWCEKQGIFYQSYLTQNDFKILPEKAGSALTKSMFILRDSIVNILRRFIPGPKESGLAEALLIGFKDDLDKSLIQSYSNTGVIHVIAISGLHLGLIYMLLGLLCKPLANRKWMRIIRPIFIITGLWAFGFLAGGSPSIFRSALMFTCIAIGDSISKQASIYNSLAASAFLLLCYNPYWLWDAGFQLSYTAVASLALFQQTVYNAITIPQRWLDTLWKLTATTIAAQTLTLPVVLFLFHQFPVFFLFTNLVAIPLSSLILLGEILLCLIHFLPILANPTGIILSWLIKIMNGVVESIDQIPLTSITHININLLQLILLYAAIAAAGIWLLHKQKRMVIPALLLLIGYFSIGAYDGYQIRNQQCLLVYHLPQSTAIDCIIGHHFVSAGDSAIQNNFNAELYSFGPSRNLFEIRRKENLEGMYKDENLIRLGPKTMIIVDSGFQLPPAREEPMPAADVLLVSHNPRLIPEKLLARLPARMVVIDGSNSARNTQKWLEICRKSGIPCHSTANQGAFVLNAY